jgi:FtsH-binding integral membrane protein
MQLDVRTPIGLMFALVGAILCAYGAATSGAPMYERSLGMNVNLWWGLCLLLFGGVMLLLARIGRRKQV